MAGDTAGKRGRQSQVATAVPRNGSTNWWKSQERSTVRPGWADRLPVGGKQ